MRVCHVIVILYIAINYIYIVILGKLLIKQDRLLNGKLSNECKVCRQHKVTTTDVTRRYWTRMLRVNTEPQEQE